MKLAGGLLLTSCALLSTLCVANARSIMAVNQQDDYEATLQDLYNSMALKQQEDDGNKMAKVQFLEELAGHLLPIALNVAKHALGSFLQGIAGQEEVSIQQDNYEATLQDLYDSMALMEQQEVDDGDQQAKEQMWRTIAKFLPKLIRGGKKLLGKLFRDHGTDLIETGLEHMNKNNNDDDQPEDQPEEGQLAVLQDLYDSMAVMEQEQEDDGDQQAKEQMRHTIAKFLKLVRKFIKNHGTDLIKKVLEERNKNNDDDDQTDSEDEPEEGQLAVLQDLYDAYVMMQEDEDGGVEDGRAKVQHLYAYHRR